MKVRKIQHGKHAVVIGASLAGLFAARVLSDYFDQVTILERDPVNDIPEARKGQPQTVHIHGLLTKGLQLLEQYFPGIGEALIKGGALSGDFAEQVRWHQFGGYKVKGTSGVTGMTMSRPFLEWHVRQRVLALRNVTLRSSCAASELITSGDKKRVIGVRVTDRAAGNQTELLRTGLIVDASGRGSSAFKWLDQLGYALPDEEEVKIKVGYATRLYRRDPYDQTPVMISADPPTGRRGAYLFPIEGDRWIVTAGGYLGDYPPTDEAGFLDFLRNLPTSDIYDILLRAEPLSEIVPYKYPASVRRHYEKLNRFPHGYLVLGDAFASFNPIYGQGMTSAALQAQALDEILSRRRSLHGVWRPFFRDAAKVVDTPWQLAVGEDFRYPETEGKKSPWTDWLNAYVLRVHRAAQHDLDVYTQFLRVMNLIDPPVSLLTPRIVWRVWKQRRQNNRVMEVAVET